MDWLKFNANLNLNDSLKLMKFYATDPKTFTTLFSSLLTINLNLQ